LCPFPGGWRTNQNNPTFHLNGNGWRRKSSCPQQSGLPAPHRTT
jgi:hypothetical protein